MKSNSNSSAKNVQKILDLLNSSTPYQGIEFLQKHVGNPKKFLFFDEEFRKSLYEILLKDPTKESNICKHWVLNVLNIQEQRNICRNEIKKESQRVLNFKKKEVVRFISVAEFISHLLPVEWKKTINCPNFNSITYKAAEKFLGSSFKEELPIEKPEDVKSILEYWQLLIDELVLEEIQSAILYDGFILQPDVDGMATNTWPWDLENSSKSEEIKNSIRTRIYQTWNSYEVSKDQHFVVNDPKYQTNKGLGLFYVSEGVEIFEKNAPGPVISVEGSNKDWQKNAMIAQQMQFLFTFYRRELERNFVPKEFFPIRKSKVEINGEVFRSHTLVALASFLTAFSKVANEGFPAINQKENIRNCLQETRINLPIEDPNIFDLANFTYSFFKSDSFKKEFAFEEFNIEQVHNLILNNEDLKELTKTQLAHIFKFLAKEKFLPGVFLIDDRIFLIHNLILSSNFSNLVIQRTILPNLFPGEEANYDKEPTHIKREKEVCESIGTMIEESGFKVLVNHKFENPNYKEEGEFDLLVISEEEKLALVIEVKLRNGGNLGRKGKSDWEAARIPEAIAQLEKDLRLFEKSNEGLKIGKTHFHLNLEGYQFEYLILTDNFICDHQNRILNNKLPYETIVVSIFEVQCLLNYDFTDPLIVELRNSIKDSKGNISLERFIEALFEDQFWKTLIQPELTTSLPEFGTYRINPRFKLQY